MKYIKSILFIAIFVLFANVCSVIFYHGQHCRFEAGKTEIQVLRMQHGAWHNARYTVEKPVKSCFCCKNNDGAYCDDLHRPSQPHRLAVAFDGQGADRRYPDPGDHGARAAGAPVARVSGIRLRGDHHVQWASSHTPHPA